MFSPIPAVFGQDIATHAHVKRPDSAYKEPCVFLLSISVHICVYVSKFFIFTGFKHDIHGIFTIWSDIHDMLI